MIQIQLPVFLCMWAALCVCVCVHFLVCRSGIAEAEESRQVEWTEPVAAAALEMSQMVIIHIHVVDSDIRGLAGDVCNHNCLESEQRTLKHIISHRYYSPHERTCWICLCEL